MTTRRNRRKPYVSQYRREQVQDGIFMWVVSIAIGASLFVPAFL